MCFRVDSVGPTDPEVTAECDTINSQEAGALLEDLS